MNTLLTQQLHISFPLVMAPMFLVSNQRMMEEALLGGIAGVFPTLNYRDDKTLLQTIVALHKFKKDTNATGNFGVNLIVQKSNPLYLQHLKICINAKVPFYITSLGNPFFVIEEAKKYGAKVYCDVTNLAHAQKAASVGCDGFVAVGMGAGGHAGNFPLSLLVPALKKAFPHLPVMGAGGIADGAGITAVLAMGADAAYSGTRFIASHEAGVSEAYKQAIVKAGMEDIVLSDRLSGTPSNIINTAYAQKIGLHQNWIESILNNNQRTKKYFKMFTQIKGMKKLEASVRPGNYNNLWSAGQSVELINDISSCAEIIATLKEETSAAFSLLHSKFEQQ
ncbi:MAG: nitronate monooxygenase [Bacteroidia bacterium]|nr:nitronate monooxygenase [Bacteroidia bacterium]